MIKFLVDSKYLSKKLREINFMENVLSIIINKDSIVLNADEKAIEIQVHMVSPSKAFPFVDRQNRNWDDVLDVVAKAPQQPIVIELFNDVTRVIFEL